MSEKAPIRIRSPFDEVMKRSSRRMLRLVNAYEGRAPYWYGDVNAYHRLDILSALGLVSIVYVVPGQNLQQVYLTDKGKRVVRLMEEINQCMAMEPWDAPGQKGN